MPMRLVTLLVLAALAGVSDGYLTFADRIPNGRFVPHPCKPNELWEGVGHFNVDGGGHRNQFGLDFKAAGLAWTKELCRKDSDGDGMTNGEELGDPDCVWEVDAMPATTRNISHPGICNPYENLDCKRKTMPHALYRTQEEWMANACKREEFTCEGLDSPDVKNQTLRFPPTQVPAKETTYICTMFDFEAATEDVHMIATKPFIDNREVMHHMVLFGCEGEVELENGDPFECDMTPHPNCSKIVGLWTIGVNGQCVHRKTGKRMGLRGYKRVALQFHWNNPEKRSTYNDSSGMTLYYTKNLREYDTAVLTIGSTKFVIPPRQKHVEVVSICKSQRTKDIMTQPIHITGAFNHMHYLGVSMTIEQIRGCKTIRNITNDLIYSYDSPKSYRFDDPFVLQPGDELRTTCNYNSMSRVNYTYFGDSTQEEMCFGFISYYPPNAMRRSGCLTRSLVFSDCDVPTVRGCNMNSFQSNITNYWLSAVNSKCSVHGPCKPNCKQVISEARRNEPCMREEDLWQKFKADRLLHDSNGFLFLGALASCEPEMAREQALASCPTSKAAPLCEGGVVMTLLVFLLAVIC